MSEEAQVTSGTPDAAAAAAAIPNWKDSLPEDLRGGMDKFNDVADLATSYSQLEKKIGSSIRPPSEEAGPEDWEKFRKSVMEKDPSLLALPDDPDSEVWDTVYKQLGRPEEASGYTIPEIEGLDISDDRLNFIREAAHKAGVGGRQFESVIGQILQADAEVMSGRESERLAGLEALHNEWGMAYDDKVARASKIAEATGAPKKLVEALSAGKADAATLKWLDSLGGSLGKEDAQIASQFGGSSDRMTPDEALARASEIMTKLDSMPPSDPAYQGLVKKRVENMRIANSK